MARTLIPSGSPYENKIGFSRAVRVGNFISVAGTAPIDLEGNTCGVGDAYTQMHQCLKIAQQALEQAGGNLSQTIRTRTMLTDISNWEAVGRAHGEFFNAIRPVNTIVEVSGFIDPEWLVEIELDAIVDSE